MFISDALGDFVGSTVSGDNALVYDNDSVAHSLNFGEDVRRKDDCVTLSELLDKRSDFDNLIRVKTNRRLIEDEYGRVVYKSLCKTDSLTITL